MAHHEQLQFLKSIKSRFPESFENVKVLDVGSLDINGNNRILFEKSDYTGIDVGDGRNVDIVSLGHEFKAPADSYDTIISTECFEHDMYFEKTLRNIIRMLKPGGLFVFTCATAGRPEHGTSRSEPDSSPLTSSINEWTDYYKNITEDDIRSAINIDRLFSDYMFTVREHDLYFYGISRLYPEDCNKTADIILGIPTLRRYDLLEKCITSAMSGSLKPDRVVVIDNGGTYSTSDSFVEVIRPGKPLSVSGAWNYIMDNYYGLKIIPNDDIEMSPDTIKMMVESYYSQPDYSIYLGYGYSCFLLRDKTYREVGRFDENLYPAYFEDNDYSYRLKLAGKQTLVLSDPGIIHHGSSTIKTYNEEEMARHHTSFRRNQAYYILKWGGMPDKENVKMPYVRDILPA